MIRLPKLFRSAGAGVLAFSLSSIMLWAQAKPPADCSKLPSHQNLKSVLQGVIKEGSEVLSEDMDEDTKDAAIIGAAQRVEHYEIAGYGTARTHADLLGLDEDARLLEETLEEEKETDQKLTSLAENINVQAEQGSEESEGTTRSRRSTPARRKPAA